MNCCCCPRRVKWNVFDLLYFCSETTTEPSCNRWQLYYDCDWSFLASPVSFKCIWRTSSYFYCDMRGLNNNETQAINFSAESDRDRVGSWSDFFFSIIHLSNEKLWHFNFISSAWFLLNDKVIWNCVARHENKLNQFERFLKS